MESKLWLADFPREYYVAATKALLKARPVESAVDDLLGRILRDLPTDLNGYIESQRAALASYFEPTAPTGPKDPERGSPEYDAHFLNHLSEISGPTVASEEKPEGSNTGPTPPPTTKTFKRGQDGIFIENLQAVARGEMIQEP